MLHRSWAPPVYFIFTDPSNQNILYHLHGSLVDFGKAVFGTGQGENGESMTRIVIAGPMVCQGENYLPVNFIDLYGVLNRPVMIPGQASIKKLVSCFGRE